MTKGGPHEKYTNHRDCGADRRRRFGAARGAVAAAGNQSHAGRASPGNRHARSAFIYAYVLSGEVRSQVDDEPVRVYRPGETWFERPGSYHRVSENASNTKSARLLAVLIVDAADKQLVIPDPQ
jgi:quercetin dioxygenase-like cupin family protein